MRRTIIAMLAAIILASSASSAQEPPAPFQEVNGDGWITSNARFSGAAWQARTVSRPSFGLQLGEENDIPFERGTAGATFWVRDAGCSVAIAAFGNVCGWKLALAITQFRAVVVGGNGIEIDGLSLKPPYGRIASASDGTVRRFGLTENIFADWSGVDVATAPRWFAGFNVDRDRYEIARGTSSALIPLAIVDAGGTFHAPTAAVQRIDQDAASAFAARGIFRAGRFVFTFHNAFAHTPVCVASSEGTAAVHVRSSPTECTVISATTDDTSVVNVQVTGDPD